MIRQKSFVLEDRLHVIKKVFCLYKWMHLVAKSRMPDSLDTNKCVCWTIEHGILSDPI